MNAERATRNGERQRTQPVATGRKRERIRMSMERNRMFVERQQTERERRADAKGMRSSQEQYLVMLIKIKCHT